MVDALSHMGSTIDKEMQSLLTYYGESSDTAENAKPEDFFALIISFSSALNVRIHSLKILNVLTSLLYFLS